VRCRRAIFGSFSVGRKGLAPCRTWRHNAPLWCAICRGASSRSALATSASWWPGAGPPTTTLTTRMSGPRATSNRGRRTGYEGPKRLETASVLWWLANRIETAPGRTD
jgi:hypothetical protein